MEKKSINYLALSVLGGFILLWIAANSGIGFQDLKQVDKSTIGVLAFVCMMILIVVGVPIGFAMLMTSAVGFFIVGRSNFAESQFSLTFVDQGTAFVFVAVPLYFLMGQIVQRTNIAYDLYECVYRWFGRLPGGLAISSVIACGGFGAVSGGSVTVVATMGHIFIPSICKYNYDDALSIM